MFHLHRFLTDGAYLLFLVRLGEQLLGHDLAREYLLGGHVGELVAAREAALAQKLALQVSRVRGRIDHDVGYGDVLLAAGLRRRHLLLFVV